LERTEAVSALAYALAPGNLDRLGDLLPQVVPQPLPPEVAYEIVLQSLLFFGYPQALEAAKIFSHSMATSGNLRWRQADDLTDSASIRRRGEQLCSLVYRGNHQRLIDNVQSVSPELADWMVADAYGKVLSRPGPTALEREIASIVFLVCSGHPVQLYSHVRGARNLGAARDEIEAAIRQSGLAPRQLELVRATTDKVYKS
jgi:4-carboxymuconolactone decarboxylase